MTKPARIPSKQRQDPVTIYINGKQLVGYRGETIATALLASGILILRYSKKNSTPRGLYCGSGICHECLVTVNDKPGVRACITYLEEGMHIETGEIQ